MGFCTEENSVRVDLFKPSGKWSETVAVKGANYHGCIYASVKKALKSTLGDSYVGYTAVCLEPFHELSHPISFIVE